MLPRRQKAIQLTVTYVRTGTNTQTGVDEIKALLLCSLKVRSIVAKNVAFKECTERISLFLALVAS